MDLVARERGATFENFTTVASGLTMDDWHLIKVVCDLETDTYTVYVDGVYRSRVTSYTAKGAVTHISFSQWNDGAGTFYVDNVAESALPATYALTLDAAPSGAGTTSPAVGLPDILKDRWLRSKRGRHRYLTSGPATLRIQLAAPVLDGDRSSTTS
jgi:hypothetical protein